LSSPNPIATGRISIFPIGFQMEAYKSVFRNPAMKDSFIFTVILTLLYTCICMIMTIMAAYALTRKKLKGRKYFMIAIIFTMYFNGGIIPNYLLVNNLHLIDNIWSLILPGMISAYNLIILKSFFSSLPETLIEAAHLDGCSEIKTLTKIILPLSLPVLATLGLFYAVGRWNSFQDALFYINSPKFYTLQLRLREIVIMDRLSDMTSQEGISQSRVLSESLKSATVIVSTLPILLVYPWLQKYFISGVLIGGVKE